MLYKDLEEGYLETMVGKIHYKENEGTKQNVVFLHGFGADMLVWSRLVEQLPKDLGIYLIDLLGHGRSEAPTIDYTLDVQIGAVEEFIDKKEIENAYIFGNSYGGWIAAAIAQGSYKGNGIILEDSVGLKDYFDDMIKQEGEAAYRQRLINDALPTNPNRNVVESIVNSQKEEWLLTKESLSSIAKPTLIIWGKDDKKVDVKYARMFSDYIKGSMLEVIAGAGHVPHFTNASKVKDLLLKFVGYKA